MIRRIRLTTGLILFAYVATHLLNHALGLISFRAMEEGRVWFLALWRNPIGTTALYGALLVHFSLALWAIYERRRLRYSAAELAQLVLGLAVPLLLAQHAIGTRLVDKTVNDMYSADAITRAIVNWSLFLICEIS